MTIRLAIGLWTDRLLKDGVGFEVRDSVCERGSRVGDNFSQQEIIRHDRWGLSRPMEDRPNVLNQSLLI